MADVLHIFGDGLAARPAVARARQTWADAHARAQRFSVQGVRVGDPVTVELKPGIYWSGHVAAWRQGAREALALQSATVAEVRLDPGHPAWASPLTIRRRDRLFPVQGPKA